MSIYDYDIDIVSEQITPPDLRQSKFLAWLKVITKPVQNIYDLVFNDYKDGSVYSDYSNVTAYVKTDKVIFTDNKVYQCIKDTTGNNPLKTEFWVLINENFIGVNERVKYNGQIIVLEKHLNKWFRNELAVDQIYIETQIPNASVFVMGATGNTSSKMANDSNFSTSYMGLVPSFSAQYNMIIYFPVALYTALNATPANREKIVRNYVDKYIITGITYNIVTY